MGHISNVTTFFLGKKYFSHLFTCDNPKYIDTVSDIYKNRPSAATANAKPSNDWKGKYKCNC